MVEPQTPQTDPNVASLEDLDKLIESEDPGFNKELDAVKSVAPAPDVHIESEVEVSADAAPSAGEGKPEKPASKLVLWLRGRGLILQARFRQFKAQAIVFVKTVPKDFALYLLAVIKRLLHIATREIGAIAKLTRLQKLALATAVLLLALTVWIVRNNLRGTWLPNMLPPILTGFDQVADESFSFKKEEVTPFFKAFPQDAVMFLLPKIIVNLRKSEEHQLPMGAFEIFLQVDSRDTAIEMQTRQVELHDAVQRTIEGMSYNDLVSDLGKNRAKGLIKHDVNKLLTQGVALDVHFKTFVLKP